MVLNLIHFHMTSEMANVLNVMALANAWCLICFPAREEIATHVTGVGNAANVAVKV